MNMNTTTNNSRLTLVSALADGKPSIVAEVLLKQGRTNKEVQSFAKVMSAAVKLAEQAIKERQKKEAEEAERVRLEQEQQRKADALILKQAQEGINHAKKIYLETLLAGGMDKKLATEMVEREFSHVYPLGKVTINYKGKVFETSVKGKASDDLKEVMQATGWGRKQIIEHFAVHA